MQYMRTRFQVLTAIGIAWISFLILYLPLAAVGVPYTYNNVSIFLCCLIYMSFISFMMLLRYLQDHLHI